MLVLIERKTTKFATFEVQSGVRGPSETSMEHIAQTCFSLAAASDASAGTADAAAPEAASDESCVFLGVRAWGAG